MSENANNFVSINSTTNSSNSNGTEEVNSKIQNSTDMIVNSTNSTGNGNDSKLNSKLNSSTSNSNTIGIGTNNGNSNGSGSNARIHHWSATEQHLEDAFKDCGKIVSSRIIRDTVTNTSKGYGFVNFATEKERDFAVEIKQDICILGNPVVVRKGHDQTHQQYCLSNTGQNSFKTATQKGIDFHFHADHHDKESSSQDINTSELVDPTNGMFNAF
ncbi:hypothetical protein RFI_28212 [Reticulomyxa filosa]|uniref:RRM domain-containing protein n=1 Tax=Reticulomyxa filosa TaxID=46433 RepID=X6M5H5_RETFI|nr:hypothetical protein RFI_28212 [Reticulomyxa filosa]|eukprot:ETO09174.1 hypothetical protein RFI_28212 [Reticulomyxa filosa]